ncbi:UNVERIFIED_CONTAM: hypothetical protein FKN15_062564 [Acipenser sinensis]
MEEDPDLPASVVSVETSDDGTTRRTETTVKKVVKTVTTRTVIPSVSVSDALSLDGSIQGGNGFSGGSVQGGGAPGNGGGYNATLERMYRGGGGGTPTPPAGNMYMGPPGTATMKSDVRRLKGIPALVSLLDHPKKDVHYSACGALKNISFGREGENKVAIKNCDGVPALVRLLRKARDQDLTDCITDLTEGGSEPQDLTDCITVDHALHALSDEVMVPRSGWEREQNEDSKPRHIEWETALTNTAGCLRNVSSERSEARRKLRECSGLVDALMYIVQSQINRQDVDNKLVENCVCLLRNLSYQVHREVPGCERYQENNALLSQSPNTNGTQRASCFGSKKGKGYELLFQPEVVRLYTSLLKESKIPAVLEAAAGALQNLCAGRWTQKPAKNLSEETTVSVLSTMNEVLQNNLEAAKKLREAQGIEKLVLMNKDGNRTDREVRGAGLVLQTVWGYKELRKPLEKEGWKKTDFMVNLNPAPRNQGYEDSTLPLMDKRAEKLIIFISQRDLSIQSHCR